MRECYLVEFDLLEYRKSLELQQKIRQIKENNRNFSNFLLLLQHNPVFTIGKKGSRKDILVSEEFLNKKGIDVIEVKRGGEVTYHGPGQVVIYFHLNLASANISVDDFVWKMEELVIKVLKEYNIEGWRMEGYPGVWINFQNKKWKIAAIGARASKLITSHGLALNVNTKMNHFQLIVPCGIRDYGPISMETVLGRTIDIKDVFKKSETAFEQIFRMKLKKITEKQMEEMIKEYASN